MCSAFSWSICSQENIAQKGPNPKKLQQEVSQRVSNLLHVLSDQKKVSEISRMGSGLKWVKSNMAANHVLIACNSIIVHDRETKMVPRLFLRQMKVTRTLRIQCNQPDFKIQDGVRNGGKIVAILYIGWTCRTLKLCFFYNFVPRLLQICTHNIQSIVNTWWKFHLVVFSTFDTPSNWKTLLK